MLADIYGWFAEDFDDADFKYAKVTLDELNMLAERPRIMRCSKCGYQNPEGMKFCEQCTDSLRRLRGAINGRRHFRAVRRPGRARGPSAGRVLCRAQAAGRGETLKVMTRAGATHRNEATAPTSATSAQTSNDAV